jgi:hypothetical protein
LRGVFLAAGIRELTSVCFKIIEIPDRRVGALLGPNGAHIKSLQEVLRCKMGVADNSSKPGSRFVRWATVVPAHDGYSHSPMPLLRNLSTDSPHRQHFAQLVVSLSTRPDLRGASLRLLQHLGLASQRQGGG